MNWQIKRTGSHMMVLLIGLYSSLYLAHHYFPKDPQVIVPVLVAYGAIHMGLSRLGLFTFWHDPKPNEIPIDLLISLINSDKAQVGYKEIKVDNQTFELKSHYWDYSFYAAGDRVYVCQKDLKVLARSIHNYHKRRRQERIDQENKKLASHL